MAVVSLEITFGLLSLVGCDCCSLSFLLVVLWAKDIALLGRTVLLSSSLAWGEQPAVVAGGCASFHTGVEHVPLLLFGVALFLLLRDLTASVFL